MNIEEFSMIINAIVEDNSEFEFGLIDFEEDAIYVVAMDGETAYRYDFERDCLELFGKSDDDKKYSDNFDKIDNNKDIFFYNKMKDNKRKKK